MSTSPQRIDLLIRDAAEVVTARTDAGAAVGRALDRLEVIGGGAVAVDAGRIVDVGPTPELASRYRADEVLEATGRVVSPGLVDPHSHLVFAGSRHEEYEAILTDGKDAGGRLGGGIRYTVDLTRRASAEELVDRALGDLDVMLAHGTTTVEAKSGYGLDRETELRLLEVIADVRGRHPVEVVPTYLAAHVPPDPQERSRREYVELATRTLDEARAFAEYCDVCCDPVGFTAEECLAIAARASELGYGLRVHADQTGWAGGGELAARLGATSADHLDYVSDDAIAALADSGTVGVLLPGVNFHMLELTPGLEDGKVTDPPKRFLPERVAKMVGGGMGLALSADYNPGSSPTQSMQIVMQLAARLYRLSYAAIWHMATINAAHALGRGSTSGSLESGRWADLVVWTVPEHGLVINRFGVNLVDTVVKRGRVVVREGRPLDVGTPSGGRRR